MQRETARCNGIDIVYDGLGRGQSALLLHAGGERRRVWYPVMEYLDKKGLRSIACDQRGHGDSGGTTADGVIAFAADTALMVAHLRGCPVIVGASLGGFAAMLALADLKLQSDVAGLILVDVIPDPDPSRVCTYLAGEERQALGRSPLVSDILDRAEQFLGATASLHIPVLLVRSGKGSAITDEEVARLSMLVPQLQTTIVENAGHLIARDAPTELAELIAEFMQSDKVRARHIQWIGKYAHPIQAKS
ncbi:MAG: alpha/beta hydrolase [Parvibaculum sp.]|nr:alpha/beta hydrolase [Parvibaculum sp.]